MMLSQRTKKCIHVWSSRGWSKLSLTRGTTSGLFADIAALIHLVHCQDNVNVSTKRCFLIRWGQSFKVMFWTVVTEEHFFHSIPLFPSNFMDSLAAHCIPFPSSLTNTKFMGSLVNEPMKCKILFNILLANVRNFIEFAFKMRSSKFYIVMGECHFLKGCEWREVSSLTLPGALL